MRQELRTWRSEAGSRIWLSALIAAMEDASRPDREQPRVPVEALAQLRAKLALPAAGRPSPACSRHY